MLYCPPKKKPDRCLEPECCFPCPLVTLGTPLRNPQRSVRTFSQSLFRDLLSGPLLTSSKDLLSRHFDRISLKTSFQDLLPQPSLRTFLRSPSLPVRTASQDFSRDLLRGPLQDFLSRHLLKSSLMSSLRHLLSDLLSGPLSRIRIVLSEHFLRSSAMTSFKTSSLVLSGPSLTRSSQDFSPNFS